MCGRFTLTRSPEEIAEHLGLDAPQDLIPRFNIAPGQDVATVFIPQSGQGAVARLRRWGLIPSWAKDERIGNRQINARAETVAEKPAFRRAFRKTRCLVPADAYYEWSGTSPHKQAYLFGLEAGALFAFAGLWERWQQPGGGELESCTLLTTEANSKLHEIHARMPVIVEPENYALWLDPEIHDPGCLRPVIDSNRCDGIRFYPVSSYVNQVRHDDPRCLERVDVQPTLL